MFEDIDVYSCMATSQIAEHLAIYIVDDHSIGIIWVALLINCSGATTDFEQAAAMMIHADVQVTITHFNMTCGRVMLNVFGIYHK